MDAHTHTHVFMAYSTCLKGHGEGEGLGIRKQGKKNGRRGGVEVQRLGSEREHVCDIAVCTLRKQNGVMVGAYCSRRQIFSYSVGQMQCLHCMWLFLRCTCGLSVAQMCQKVPNALLDVRVSVFYSSHITKHMGYMLQRLWSTKSTVVF